MTKPPDVELKACPFCARKVNFIINHFPQDEATMFCEGCGITYHLPCKAIEAFEFWNTRPTVVVWPERKKPDHFNNPGKWGWNRCLDKFKRLNPQLKEG